MKKAIKYKKLKALISSQDDYKERLENVCKIKYCTYYNKITGFTDFTLQECISIKNEFAPNSSIEKLFGEKEWE